MAYCNIIINYIHNISFGSTGHECIGLDTLKTGYIEFARLEYYAAASHSLLLTIADPPG